MPVADSVHNGTSYIYKFWNSCWRVCVGESNVTVIIGTI